MLSFLKFRINPAKIASITNCASDFKQFDNGTRKSSFESLTVENFDKQCVYVMCAQIVFVLVRNNVTILKKHNVTLSIDKRIFTFGSRKNL